MNSQILFQMTSFNLESLNAQEKDIPEFILKLYSILQNTDFAHIIGWSSTGTEIEIKNQKRLENLILPTYFRHQKLESFVRQLNMYRFKKVSKIGKDRKNIYFKNQFFRRQNLKLLHLIKRRRKGQEEQDTEFERGFEEYKTFIKQHIGRIQQNLNVLLSRYPEISPELSNILQETEALTGEVFSPTSTSHSSGFSAGCDEPVRGQSIGRGIIGPNRNLARGQSLRCFDSKCSLDANFFQNFLN